MRKVTVLVFLFLSSALHASVYSTLQLKMKDGKTFSYQSTSFTTNFDVIEEPLKFIIKDHGFWEETYQASCWEYTHIDQWLTGNSYPHLYYTRWPGSYTGDMWEVVIEIGKESLDEITVR